ncbi:ABC transporter substrate-binding protein [Cohnella abietis]|uniref:ABC transporter substrate-binding protein n=1 Tax=Cohnella abietis TaxID=2507935 RepID=A0A3T1CXX2_9BACL|nr:extracellular solute-binding protein [Cohnella abietis]BBI30712.1 hypothetical protein KCTCHS21_01110 [Cohnella abietis]
MKKIYLLMTMTVMAVFLLAGCGKSESNNTASLSTESEASSPTASAQSEEKHDPVSLQFWHYQGGSYKDTFVKIVEEFEKEYPWITIKYNFLPPEQYGTGLQAAIAAKETPDMFISTPTLPLKLLVDQDVVRTLDDFITPDKREQYVPGVWTEGSTTLNGKTYSIPTTDIRNYSAVVFYNKKLLGNAGITEVPNQLSWDQFIDISKKVMDNNPGVLGAAFPGKASWVTGRGIIQMVSAISPEDTAPTSDIFFNYQKGEIEFGKGLEETIQFFKRLYDEKVVDTNSLLYLPGETRALFWENKLGFIFENTENVQTFPHENNDAYGITNVPTKNGKSGYIANQGKTEVGVYVSNSSKHFEEIKLFLQYFQDQYYPALIKKGMNTSPIQQINETVKSDFDLFNQSMSLRDGAYIKVPIPANRNINTIDVDTEFVSKRPTTTWDDIFKAYLTGQIKDLPGELDSLNKQYNKVFKDVIASVNSSGKTVSQSDYVYPDWTPPQPYDK